MARGFNECLLHVYWTTGGEERFTMRGKVSADLGLDAPPDPPFTNEEMQKIMFAAKMQVIKCLRARKKVRG